MSGSTGGGGSELGAVAGEKAPRAGHERRITSAVLRGGALALKVRARLESRRGVARQADLDQDRFYERVWREAAAALGAGVGSFGGGVLEIRRDHGMVRVCGQLSPVDDQVTLDVAGNKPLVYRLLAADGIPVPRHRVFTLATFERSSAFLAELTGPAVVKPAVDGYGGRAVTTGIRTRRQLVQAAMLAARGRGDVLIETEVSGRNFRVLLFDGEVLDVVERQPPTVVGDGVSSVRALVEAENGRRCRSATEGSIRLLSFDLDMRHTLSRRGLSLNSVPALGERLVVKTAINQNAANENTAANESLCDEILEQARTAARLVGAEIAGVDIVTTDPSVPLATVAGVVLEVNTTPGLHIHHHRRGCGFPAATEILRRLLEREERRDSAAG